MKSSSGMHFIGLGHIRALAAFRVCTWHFTHGRDGYPVSFDYPSPSPIWIFLPTIEAAAYASLISWYDMLFAFSTNLVSRFIGRMGEFSYSIYLFSFLFRFRGGTFRRRKNNGFIQFLRRLCMVATVLLVALSRRFFKLPLCRVAFFAAQKTLPSIDMKYRC